MCRQAWFKPGDSARDVKSLAEFFAQLEKSCGGHGNGVGWMDDETGKYEYVKGVKLGIKTAAEYVANRPKNAWGTFHTRLVSAGTRGTDGCHPHVYEATDNRRLVMLTHNGTWSGWTGACLGMNQKYPSDSATIAALVAMYGWARVAPVVEETIVCVVRGTKGVYARAWRDCCPLVLLSNDGIASEGGDGEFVAVKNLAKGGHDLRKPRTEALPKPTVKTYTGGRGIQSWLDDHYGDHGGGRGSYGRDYSYLAGADSSDGMDRHSDLKDIEGYGWVRCQDGTWRKKDEAKEPAKDNCLLPGVVEVTTEVVEDKE